MQFLVRKLGSNQNYRLTSVHLVRYLLYHLVRQPLSILTTSLFHVSFRPSVEMLDQMADEFYRLYKDDKITRILTIEASGIAVAVPIAQRFHVPVVFAKKAKSKNIGEGVYTSHVHSYTYNKDFMVTVSKDYLNEDDHILIVDDFLANGLAADGLIDIARQSGAKIVGLGICVEKHLPRWWREAT